MRLLRYLPHWLDGGGPCLQVVDVVPEAPPIRQWAETFPGAALVAAMEQRVARRFPTRASRGRPSVAIRVLLALEWLKHELGAADEALCPRLRTAFAVMDACGLRTSQAPRPQAHLVLPDTLADFRRRIDEALMDELSAIPAAAALEQGWVSPAHLVVDPFPAEQGTQRVTDATRLYTAPKQSSNSLQGSAGHASRARPRWRPKRSLSPRTSSPWCVASAANAEARGQSWSTSCARVQHRC